MSFVLLGFKSKIAGGLAAGPTGTARLDRASGLRSRIDHVLKGQSAVKVLVYLLYKGSSFTFLRLEAMGADVPCYLLRI